MEEIAFLPAREIAALIARREVGSRELLEVYLDRIARLDGDVRAVVALDAERARARADAADVALARGESWGPLHGVPMTIKDTFEVAGLRTTAGARELADHVPERDAVAVRRLLGAGAVIFGKTNVPFMAMDVQTYNAVHGRTDNPWDPSRTPGGSSGGAAAALAAGFTALEYGSDIGGSIRTPANWCGVYGHKPTHGIVPHRGHIPGPPGTHAEPDLGVVGPLGRSADDLDLALAVTAGPSGDRAVAWRLELPAARRSRLRDYRVAAWLDDPAAPVAPEVATCLRGAIDELRRAGVTVDEDARPPYGLPDVVRTYQHLLFSVTVAGLPDPVFARLTATASELTGDDAYARVARFGTCSHREWLGANEARERMRAGLGAFFRDYDVLLMPGAGVPAIPHDPTDPMTSRTIDVGGVRRSYYDLFSWIALATLTFHPATMAPIGQTAAGLPVGLQIVGPYLEDRTPIDFARGLAGLVGGFRRPPGF
ncbi:MAG TPA: amidase [Candidatus Binatia bacterium]|nr:amidase [Candidatus Binatia bacterium]